MSMRAIERALVKKVFCGSLFFYSPAEISKLTQTSLSNTCKELKKMTKRGILEENNILKFKKTYRLNRDYYNKWYK